MVNQQTGEFVLSDGAIWWGRGTNFFMSLPKTSTEQNFECQKRQKLETSGKKFFVSCSIMFLKHQFQKDFDNSQINEDENKFIKKTQLTNMFYYNVYHPKKKRRASCLCSNDDIIYITDTKSSRHTNSSVKKCYVNA